MKRKQRYKHSLTSDDKLVSTQNSRELTLTVTKGLSRDVIRLFINKTHSMLVAFVSNRAVTELGYGEVIFMQGAGLIGGIECGWKKKKLK